MPAEESQELGRKGVMNARVALHTVFGKGMDLPFNAYDHPEKVTFEYPDVEPKTFSFDLRGTLRRADLNTVTGSHTVEVFVEVKTYSEGSALKSAYAEFLRQAAIVGSIKEHEKTWFLFVSSVPFGTKAGVQLCDGTFLDQVSHGWGTGITAPPGLHLRIALVFVTLSLKRTLEEWVAAAS